jgi:7-carboxy-7-deazaguanine synthase
MLDISEIFHSIQGEGTRTGIPCVFIRLAGCNLRCKWCDTKYAINNNLDNTRDLDNTRKFDVFSMNNNFFSMNIEEIIEKILPYNCDFIEITGGEPLLQNDTLGLMNSLLNLGKIVAIETNGSLPISEIDSRVIKIIDVKCPDSTMSHHNNYENFQHLTANDEVKFVIASKEDFIWSCGIIEEHRLFDRTKNLLFSAVTAFISYQELAELILGCSNSDYKNIIRLQVQIHKIIWDPTQREV